MKLNVLFVSMSALIGLAPSARALTPSQLAFEQLMTLEGTWTIRNGDETGEISYESASEGSALVEHFEGMVTVYHLDGDSLLATHYCSLGNQPRMRATEFVSPYTTLDFKFLDISNLKPGKPHIAGVKFEWKDNEHVVETWTDRDKNGKDSSFSFQMERAKKPAPASGSEHVHP